jgi:hypothetical protein
MDEPRSDETLFCIGDNQSNTRLQFLLHHGLASQLLLYVLKHYSVCDKTLLCIGGNESSGRLQRCTMYWPHIDKALRCTGGNKSSARLQFQLHFGLASELLLRCVETLLCIGGNESNARLQFQLHYGVATELLLR